MTSHKRSAGSKKSRSTSKRSRASPTKGWKRLSTSSRRILKTKCGSRCFLMPKENKFPVCAAGSCKVSCKGLVSAKVRAAQWNYPSVYKKASRMIDRKKCTKASRRKTSRKASRSKASRKVKRE